MAINSPDPRCRICSSKLVLATGPQKAFYGIIGERPGAIELKMGRPFVGQAGIVLRTELARLGIDVTELRITNLRSHLTENEKCERLDLSQTIRDVKYCQKILLLGSDCANVFLNQGVTSISGLWLPASLLHGKLVMAAENPAALLQRGSTVGEFRLALEKFFGIWQTKKENPVTLLKKVRSL